jgi:hypothetical protein
VSEGEDRAREVTTLEEAPLDGPVEPSAARASVFALLAWILPGAGHFLLGKRWRAMVLGAIVLACGAIGCVLQGRLDTIEPNDPLSMIATLASQGSGAFHFFLKFVVKYEGSIAAAGYEYGTTFLRTAGILNLLLVLDAFDIARGRKS